MRAHSQRRLIWILNVALGAALLGVVAWIVLDVRKAVADPELLEPKWADAELDEFVRRLKAPAETQTRAPVTEMMLEEIDRPGFKTESGRRYHWIYSGPLPPAPPEESQGPVEAVPVQDDLSQLGKVRMLIYVPPVAGETVAVDTVIFWEFNSGKTRSFKPGAFIQEPGVARPGNIKITNVIRKAPEGSQYTIHYSVYADPDAEPLRGGEYEYDGAAPLPQELAGLLRRRRPTPEAAEGEGAPEEAVGVERADGVTVIGGAGSDEVPSLRDLDPEVEWQDINTAHIRFDDNTVTYFRNADPSIIAEAVKTQIARDSAGQVIGLQITGISPDTPADKFDVKPGDILVSIDGRPVASREDAINLVQAMSPDTQLVRVVIDRRGRLITFNIDPRDPATRRAGRTLDNR